MQAATPEPAPERSAMMQNGGWQRDYRPPTHVCDYCAAADNGTPPRRIYSSDDDSRRLCRACIAACVDIVDDFYAEGRT